MAAVSALAGDTAGGDCLRATKAIAAGAPASLGDFEPADCAGGAAAFRYDAQAKVARARRDIKAGEVLERLPRFALPAVAPGAPLRLRAAIGRVIVERDVVAVQAAQPGERLFVRAADGGVFPVELSEAKP